MNDIIQIFREEVEINLKEATRLALELERTGYGRERIETLMRVFHTLKGAARAVQFEQEKRAAHRLEDCLHAQLDGAVDYRPELVDLTLQAVDLIRAQVEARLAGRPLPQDGDLEQRVQAYLAAEPAPPPPAMDEPPSAPLEPALPEGLDLAAIFKAQAEGHLAAAAQQIDALERTPDDTAGLAELRRLFHTLKGAARAIRFDEIRDCAAEMERLLRECEQADLPPDAALLGLARCSLGWLRTLLGARLAKAAPPDVEPLLQHLRGFPETGDLPCPDAPAQPVARPTTPPASETPPEIPAPTTAPNPTTTGRDSASVSYEHLDNLQNLGGELTVAVAAMGGQRTRLRRIGRSLAGIVQHLARLTGNLQDEGLNRDALLESLRPQLAGLRDLGGELDALSEIHDLSESRFQHLVDALNGQVHQTRLMPLSALFDDYPRMVRDLARELERAVDLETAGGANRVDRSVLEQIRNPLLHLVRNALDHGIEPAAGRAAAGKPPRGSLSIRAVHLGALVRITVADDGRGIDPQQLKRRVIERGHTTAALWDAMSRDEQLQFLFLPGFSTARTVSATSGRGFGLDIAKSGVEAVGGRVAVHSDPGRGCRFELDVPLTLSLSRCLLVQAGRHPLFGTQVCAFPVNEVDEVRRIRGDQLREIQGRMAVRIEEETLLLHPLHTILGLEPLHQQLERKHLMILSHGEERHGLLVDAVVDEQDLVARGLDPRLGKVQELSGVTLLNNGSLALIMDVPDLLQRMAEGSGLVSAQAAAGLEAGPGTDGAETARVLVVEDSVTVREVERHFLEQAGYQVHTAVNGTDGLNKAKAGDYRLIITDIDMPRMNGIEMIRQLRAMDRFEALPIIVVSYKDRQEDRQLALEAGADRYVTKSEFDTEDMLALVAELLERKEAPAAP